METLKAMTILVQVAEQNSFSKAARRLGTSPSVISNHIAALEARLGVRLIRRTTRSIALTEEGLAYVTDCRRILADIAQTEAALKRKLGTPSGTLTINAPTVIGSKLLTPALPGFLGRFPDIRLICDFSDHVMDVSDCNADIMVRIGPIPDTSLVARVMHDTESVMVAAPSYLARRGVPREPSDLVRHTCINYLDRRSGKPFDWQFAWDGRIFQIAVPSPLLFNQGGPRIDAALQGIGIIHTMRHAVEEHIRNGLLQQILAEWMPPGPPIMLVYPTRRGNLPTVSAFVDFMLDYYADRRSRPSIPCG